jgi:hypothetical protein
MKRMRTETETYTANQQLYPLTIVQDPQLVEVMSSDGMVYKELKNWRCWTLDDDPKVVQLRLASPVAETGASLVIHGYTRYKSYMTGDSDTCDLADELTWIPLQGARAYLYRRRYQEFMDYEQFANLNRDNDMDAGTLFAAYQDAEGRFQHALATHATEVSIPRRSRMTK